MHTQDRTIVLTQLSVADWIQMRFFLLPNQIHRLLGVWWMRWGMRTRLKWIQQKPKCCASLFSCGSSTPSSPGNMTTVSTSDYFILKEMLATLNYFLSICVWQIYLSSRDSSPPLPPHLTALDFVWPLHTRILFVLFARPYFKVWHVYVRGIDG